MMRKSLWALLVLALLTPILGACEPAAPATLTSPPTVQGELNLYAIDPITLDPGVSGEATSHEFILQIYSGLVRLDEDLIPVPDIARSWELNNGGKTYTFHLRPEAKFHNGRQVKAADFKYSWERASTPATGSQTAATYLGDIVGVKEMLAGKARELAGVKVLDDLTLEVTIDAPKSYFLSKMSYPTAFVVDKANVDAGKGWWERPNGTGPFKLEHWDKGSLLILARNPLYYGEPARVNSVIYHLWAGIPMNLYELGQIDVAGVSLNDIDRAGDKAGRFYPELQVMPELSFAYIGFNARRPPFDDANLRRAFSQAIDKDRLVSLVFKDMMQRADGILPPGIPGFNKALSGLKFDKAKALELIAKSKYGSVANLPRITLTVSGWGGLLPAGVEAIIEDWRRNLGVEVTVRQLEPERFLYYLKKEKDEMYFIGWIADYPHPQDFLDILFHSGADNNYGEYANPAVDALLDRAGVEIDSERSTALYQQAEQVLVDNAACLPLWFAKNYILVKPYVEGYRLSPMGQARLNRVVVKPH